ncbi:GMC family oxidoreductase [Verrucomicrobiaceae bacterium 227]
MMSKEYEYVIVGSGVAGSSLAKRLLEANRATSILILEAGPEVEARNRRHWWDYVVNANGPEYKAYDFTTDQKGESVSEGNTDFLVEGSRVMLYGGSTVHWGGWCLRYKPEDFKLKSNANMGGGDWPIDYEELDRYYEEAEHHLSVCGDIEESWNQEMRAGVPYPRPAFEYTEADGEMIQAWRKNGIEPGKMPMARYRKCMTTGTCKYCPISARFSGQLVLDELRGDLRNINFEIRKNSPVTEILVDTKSRITGVRYLDSTTGAEIVIDAGKVIVCSGAFESPKLLMQSKSAHWEDGIGNDYDQVGRYLVSHSILKVRGELDHNEENWFQEYDFPTLMSRTYDTEEYQKKNKIFLFKNRGLPNIDFGQLMIEGKSREEIDTIWKASRQQELQAFMEEIGQPDNRVRLMKGRNRFGLPKMHVYFDRTPSAQKNGEDWLKVMGKVVDDMGYRIMDGKRKPHIQDPGGHHATGTCRMGTGPENSVTDRDMRVHGTENLYVCSNAAFPSGAAVNPTLTLTAMAFRLAGHLIENS